MKILHLPTNVAGMAWGLAQGEKRLGLDSAVLATERTWLGYSCDISLEWEKKGKLRKLLSCCQAFLKYRNKYDVFHFNFGASLIDFREYGIHHLDLPFYPKGNKLIFTYNGCDIRQKYKTIERCSISPCHSDECYNGMCNDGTFDKKRQKSLEIVSRHAHHIFAVNPDLLHLLPDAVTSFLPYAIAPWYSIDPVPYRIRDKIKIIHSPTNRAAKGSSYIMKALEQLKKKYPIDVILVENKPNKEALEIYKTADLVIDQVLVGWYGGFAVEVMKMGKPVVAYIREDDLKFLPPNMTQDLKDSVINVDPFTIVTVLENYLQNPSLLMQKSQAAMDYVNKWHDPVYVASLTKEIYER